MSYFLDIVFIYNSFFLIKWCKWINYEFQKVFFLISLYTRTSIFNVKEFSIGTVIKYKNDRLRFMKSKHSDIKLHKIINREKILYTSVRYWQYIVYIYIQVYISISQLCYLRMQRLPCFDKARLIAELRTCFVVSRDLNHGRTPAM